MSPPLPITLLLMAVLLSAGCFSRIVEHAEHIRPATLQDFAGTYQNISSQHVTATLLNVLWPKRPEKPQGYDYRDINRVRVEIQSKTAIITFLSNHKVCAQIRYLEGKDFALTQSVIPLRTEADAAVAHSRNRDSGAFLPDPPVAGGAVVRGKLFLNRNRDLVIRSDGVMAMLVFYAIPLVAIQGGDYVYKRVPDADQNRH